MEELLQRLGRAKEDSRELEKLVADYLPFIKREVGKAAAPKLEYDDKVSLGMLVFVNCVRQYDPKRGAFLSYTSVCIRNRLIDEARRLGGGGTVFLSTDDEENAGASPEDRASLAAYDRQREQRGLQEEISLLAGQLEAHGLSFGQLASICPRQKRSRALCAALARQVLGEGELLAAFRERGQLPRAELARRAGVSEKTVEKYRKYIVALLLILQGDYPGIGAYIPGHEEGGLV